MKTTQWVLIACRLLTVSFGLILFSSGCSDPPASSSGGVTAEEAKRDAETRKAMEAYSKEATSKAPKKR